MPGRLICEIGFVDRYDLGLGWRDSLKCLVQVIGVFINVVYTNDPDPLAIPFQRYGLIAQDLETMAIKDFCNDIGIVPVIMIAQNRHDRSSLQLLENPRARLGMASATRAISLKKRVRNEISSEDSEIRF
jgi:hypothetical protein